MVERSCIHPFIEQTQNTFQEGETFSDVLGTIRDYQNRFNSLVTNISLEAKIPHLVAMSAIGLGTVVVWEYARSKGLPLPDSREIVTLLPVASITKENETRDQKQRRWSDEHRKAAKGQGDIYVQEGKWTREKADSEMKDWDRRHGY